MEIPILLGEMSATNVMPLNQMEQVEVEVVDMVVVVVAAGEEVLEAEVGVIVAVEVEDLEAEEALDVEVTEEAVVQ